MLLFADGVAAARDERFQTARARWLESAALGDPDAMMDLGLLYENGDGVALDLETALSWYEKAAAAGKVNAPEAVERIKKRIAHVTELEKNAASKK